MVVSEDAENIERIDNTDEIDATINNLETINETKENSEEENKENDENSYEKETEIISEIENKNEINQISENSETAESFLEIIQTEFNENEENEVTCYFPKISLDDEEKLSEKDNFKIITEKQYQLFSDSEKFDETDLNNTDVIITNEEKEENKEIKNIEEVIEPKTITINYDSSIEKFETALEIRYSSLKLKNFPVKVSNIPVGMSFPDELFIGNTSIKIGDEVINNCYLKVVSNESIKMLEIKHREFKLGLSVTLNNDTINVYGNVHHYEISSLIKHSRMIKVLEMFRKIFEGMPITFKVNKLYGDIIAEDRIETIRLKTILNFFDITGKSLEKFNFEKLSENENAYYLLELNSALKENKEIETWCNLSMNKITDINAGDSLIIKRIHNYDKNSSIEETIILKTPLSANEIYENKISIYRKPCVIQLKKINN